MGWPCYGQASGRRGQAAAPLFSKTWGLVVGSVCSGLEQRRQQRRCFQIVGPDVPASIHTYMLLLYVCRRHAQRVVLRHRQGEGGKVVQQSDEQWGTCRCATPACDGMCSTCAMPSWAPPVLPHAFSSLYPPCLSPQTLHLNITLPALVGLPGGRLFWHLLRLRGRRRHDALLRTALVQGGRAAGGGVVRVR